MDSLGRHCGMKFSILLEKFKLSLEMFNLDLLNSPQNRALVGGSLEIFSLA